jgi:uncharacterized membrane protein YhaH (DUF805 family)
MSRAPDDGDGGDARPAGAGRPDRVVVGVVAVAAVGVVLRVLGLGARPFHWDEARVGYWALRYLETGAFRYRPVAGGPLLYHLDRIAFAALGVSERVARLPVAVLGAALPTVALLFRHRLDDAETVAFAAVLAVQPLVVYYSRFLRGDVPLAVFGRSRSRRRRRGSSSATWSVGSARGSWSSTNGASRATGARGRGPTSRRSPTGSPATRPLRPAPASWRSG